MTLHISRAWWRGPQVLAVVLLALAAVSSALAQITSGKITGLVTDSSGLAVAHAQIEARDLGSNRTLKTASSPTGSYTIAGLSPGLYMVRASLAGFKILQVDQVEVRVAQTTTQNVVLEVGQVTESVSVTGEAPLINPSSAAVTTTIQNKLLMDLPFQDRSALSAILLTPGSQGDPQYNGGVQS